MSNSQQEKENKSETKEEKFAIRPPAISLPKGGGAIKGIGETFQPNPFTGTASLSVPIYTSPGRSGFGPELSLSYGSGSGNGIFGLGWSLSIPSITRKTEKGLPQYLDHEESDTFILSGAEDLVPALKKQGENWVPYELEDVSGTYRIKRYLPRTEGLFARIERWTKKADGDVHWRSITKENITSVYGYTEGARIADNTGTRIFSWLLEQTFDDKGNLIAYEYKKEDRKYRNNNEEVEGDFSIFLYEKNREGATNTYIKTIYYGNVKPIPPGYCQSLDYDKDNDGFYFKVVFDYGEHKKDYEDKDEIPELVPNPKKTWLLRKDPFSNYRSGFEIRTRRLCHHVLMFHHFPDEGLDNALVRSTDFTYAQTPELTTLLSVTQTGYAKGKKRSLPPLEFDYSRAPIDFEKCCIDEPVLEVDSDSLENLPQGLSGPYQLIDLNGVGIAGILTEQAGAWYYKAPLGKIQKGDKKDLLSFAPMVTLSSLPSRSSLQTQQIMDLDGNGYKEVVQFRQPVPGYVEREDDETWSTFHTFNSLPNIDWQDPNLQFIDLNGDGHADILITKDDHFVWYPSLKKEGFGEARYFQKPKDDEKGPALVFSDGTQSIHLADITGDGLSDLVRIQNGSVEYWSNNGYGRFGAKISMGGPHFANDKEFRQDRIHLFDTDGSGTTDILYFGSDGTKLYLNQAGNSFRDAIKINRMPVTDNQTSVQVADLHGNGTGCLTWSSPDSDQMPYIDLMGGIKPHLLENIKNNMGAETRVTYASSTKFYLNDKKEGKLWITKLPFPVYVVERVETLDWIGKTKLDTLYKYHHGYFDGKEREFRGFGMVETFDTKEFETYSKIPKDEYVKPVLTKTWFHNGAFLEQDKISTQYASEYFAGVDSNNPDILKDTVVENVDRSDTEGLREACRSLKGRSLRQEIYEYKKDPAKAKDNVPYTVAESNFTVRQIQPRGDQQHAVYMVNPREVITWHYERTAEDPRIVHELTIEVDEYGNVLKNCSVMYPRRGPNPETEQTTWYATCGCNSFINKPEGNTAVDPLDEFYLLGVPQEAKSYEIVGFTKPGAGEYLSFDRFKTDVQEALLSANTSPFDQRIDSNAGSPKSRLLSWQKFKFWNKAQDATLDLGDITSKALQHSVETAVFTPGLLDKAYGDGSLGSRVVTTEMLTNAKYNYRDGHWWNPGPIQHYLINDFCLPSIFQDPFGNKTTVTYDSYKLVPNETKDALDNTNTAEIDYRTLSTKKLTGPNGNHSEAITDPLGMVIAASIYGNEEGFEKGDRSLSTYNVQTVPTLQHVIDNPHTFLQDATRFFHYDLRATDRKPAQALCLARETHVNDLNGGKSNVQVTITYSDGFGREIQSKIKAEGGLAWEKQPDGSFREKNVMVRWLASGRTIYNNKQTPVKQYEPFYTATYEFEDEHHFAAYGETSIIHYDPLLRVIRTDKPKGFFSKVEFTPWEVRSYDLNDTVKESDYYSQRAGLSQDEQDALLKAEAHFNTPKITILDTLGREVKQKDVMEVDANGVPTVELTIYTEFDITGMPLAIIDPRQYKLPEAERAKTFQFTYDMTGINLRTLSIDAGDDRVFANVMGNPVLSLDARGHEIIVEYDALHRTIKKKVKGNGLNNVVEELEYGESIAGATAKNLRGRLYKHYDQSGLMTFDLYDIKGQVRRSEKRLRSAYKTEVNWPNIDKNALIESEKFLSVTEYDALGRVSLQYNPDQSTTRPEYNQSGRLNKLHVKLKGEPNETTFVTGISYNPKSQREKIAYDNNTETIYTYEKTTFRLTSLITTRTSDNKKLQEIEYVYDPVGNIVRITDHSHNRVLSSNGSVEPKQEYTYDALYRLVKATGRMHKDLTCQEYKNPTAFKQSIYALLNDLGKLRKYTRQYTYDDAGNLKKIQHLITNPFTRNIDVDANTNRAILHDDIHPNPNFDNYFDANGNQTKLEHLRRIEWNYRDNISQAVIIERLIPDPNDAEYYIYDSSGQRIRKVKETLRNGHTIKEVEEKIYLGGVEIKRIKIINIAAGTESLILERFDLHVMDDKNRIAIIHHWTKDNLKREIDNDRELNTNKKSYQYSNHLGSASLELDGDGKTISYEEYFPYGKTSFIAGDKKKEVNLKEYRFTGKERDDSTGLYYYGARYYAPWLGRWCSTDPAGLVDGVNIYTYSQDNPITMTDLYGFQAHFTQPPGHHIICSECHYPKPGPPLPTMEDIIMSEPWPEPPDPNIFFSEKESYLTKEEQYKAWQLEMEAWTNRIRMRMDYGGKKTALALLGIWGGTAVVAVGGTAAGGGAALLLGEGFMQSSPILAGMIIGGSAGAGAETSNVLYNVSLGANYSEEELLKGYALSVGGGVLLGGGAGGYHKYTTGYQSRFMRTSAKEYHSWVRENIPTSQRGPAGSVTWDEVTGEVFEFVNSPTKEVPSVQSRLFAERLQTWENIRGGQYPIGKGVPGSHSETFGFNEALLVREKAGINAPLSKINIYTIRLRAAKSGSPFKRCPNCRFITKGAKVYSD